MSYTDTTFNVFISGSLIEIAVVIKIAVKYLFTDNISKTLNNMMEINHYDNKKRLK